MIVSHLKQRPSYYKIGLDTDWAKATSPCISDFEQVTFPGGSTFQGTHVIIHGFITQGKLAFKFDELKDALATYVCNRIDMRKSSTDFFMRFKFGEEIHGIVTDRKFFSKHCGISKRFSDDLFTTDCLLDLKTKLDEGSDYIGTDPLFLTVEVAKPRVVEAIFYCRDRDSAGETSPVFKSICGRVEVENGRERFYCGLESFGKLLVWCSDEDDVHHWESQWDMEFYLNEDNEIAVNEATQDGSWIVIGAIENNEIWIHLGEVELWDCNENDEGCDFVCEIRGSAARRWWRILRLAIKICKILCS